MMKKDKQGSTPLYSGNLLTNYTSYMNLQINSLSKNEPVSFTPTQLSAFVTVQLTR